MWMRICGSKINEMEGKKKRGGVEGESGGAESSRCWKDGKQARKRRAGDTPRSREPRTPPARCDLRLFRTNAGGSSGRKRALAKLRACAPCARELPGVGQRERAAPDKEGGPSKFAIESHIPRPQLVQTHVSGHPLASHPLEPPHPLALGAVTLAAATRRRRGDPRCRR